MLVPTKTCLQKNHPQKYLQKSGQSSNKGSLNPIQCYGNRGPIKHLKKSVHDIFLKNDMISDGGKRLNRNLTNSFCKPSSILLI